MENRFINIFPRVFMKNFQHLQNLKNLLPTFLNILGNKQNLLLTEIADKKPYLTDQRNRYNGNALAVIFPENKEQIIEIIKLCQQHNIKIIPQGGNTSLCGAATPDSAENNVLINLAKMNQILAVNADNFTLTAQAGATLLEIQQAAERQNRLFPLSLASEGSCQIGGNLSTNAGGIHVLNYGMMRDLCLGLEVVLPNGEIFNHLLGLRKDNSGYALQQLFIGAEGTLGIITAATLRLFALPKDTYTIWLDVANLPTAISILNLMRNAFDFNLSAFEVINKNALLKVKNNISDIQIPEEFSNKKTENSWKILADINIFENAVNEFNNAENIEQWLYKNLYENANTNANFDILNIVIPQNKLQQQQLWKIRKSISEAQKKSGISLKHDISLPIDVIPDFIKLCGQQLNSHFPDINIVTFGHLGDGNLHYNLSFDDAVKQQNLLLPENQQLAHNIVHNLVNEFNGSISAEHGIGQFKINELTKYKSQVELNLMKQIKKVFDPNNIMNPNKIFISN